MIGYMLRYWDSCNQRLAEVKSEFWQAKEKIWSVMGGNGSISEDIPSITYSETVPDE